jgi:hypothetical protein
MDSFDQKYGTPTVNFDHFRIPGQVYNWSTAEQISSLLCAYADVDDILYQNDPKQDYPSTVGSSDTGFVMGQFSQTQQRLALASALSYYAVRRSHACYLAKTEYYCLRDLRDYIKHDALPSEQDQHYLELLDQVLKEFAGLYTKLVPSFLVEVIRDTN